MPLNITPKPAAPPGVVPHLPPEIRQELHAIVRLLGEAQQHRAHAATAARVDWSGPSRSHFDRTRTTLDGGLRYLTEQLATVPGR